MHMYDVFSNRTYLKCKVGGGDCGTVESIPMRAAWACKLMRRLVGDCHLNKTVDEKVISVTKKNSFCSWML